MNKANALFLSCLLMGGGLLIFFSAQLTQSLPPDQSAASIGTLILGILFVIAGIIPLQSEKFYQWLEDKAEKLSGWLTISPWQVVLLILSLIFSVLVTQAAGFGPTMISPVTAVVIWILAILCALVGTYQLTNERPHITRTTIIWCIVLAIGAFLIRGIATDRFPIVLYGDEAAMGNYAADFGRGVWNNIFINGWYDFPALYFLIPSLSIGILGHTTEALRIPSAVAGAFTVVAIYIIGKKMFGQRAGLLAALFLAALHFDIHFSRLGLNNIWDGLWFVITIGALWYGWEQEKRNGYVLAGFGLGISQYFYSSTRILLGIILAGIFLAVLFDRARLRRALPGFSLMMIIAIAIVLPLAWYYIENPVNYFAPFVRVSLLGDWLKSQMQSTGDPAWKILLQQQLLGFQGYTYASLNHWYTPETPLLRPIAAVLFYIGLIFLVLQNRDSRLALLLLWLASIAVVGGLTESTPAAQRYVAAAPACALLVGYGLHKTAEVLENLWPKFSRVITGLAFVIIAIAMASDLYFYFVTYTQKSENDNITSNDMIAQRLADYLLNKPANTEVAFFDTPDMGYFSIPSIQYLVPQVQGVDVNGPWSSFDHSKLAGHNLIFVFLPGRENEINSVQTDYPGGSLKIENNSANNVLFWVYDYNQKP